MHQTWLARCGRTIGGPKATTTAFPPAIVCRKPTHVGRGLSLIGGANLARIAQATGGNCRAADIRAARRRTDDKPRGWHKIAAMSHSLVRDIDSPDMRAAGRELLSVALMDARNHTLHLADTAAPAIEPQPAQAVLTCRRRPLAWALGHIGWFQEWWIARNMQRAGAGAAIRCATRLPSLEPSADRWWDDAPGFTAAALAAGLAGPRHAQDLSAGVAGDDARNAGEGRRHRRRSVFLSSGAGPRGHAWRRPDRDGATARCWRWI